MNERIRDLALQADKLKRDEVSYLERLHNRYLTGEMEEEIFREKFAQLIVRECADVLVKEMNRLDELGRVLPAQTMDTAQALIKQHFGVEL